MDYKNYSLDKLEEWMHDALSCDEASPYEIYSTIRKVVQDEYNYHKEQSQRCLVLLELLSDHRPVKFVDDEVQDDVFNNVFNARGEKYEVDNIKWQKDAVKEFSKAFDKVGNEVKKSIETDGYDWTPLTNK